MLSYFAVENIACRYLRNGSANLSRNTCVLVVGRDALCHTLIDWKGKMRSCLYFVNKFLSFVWAAVALCVNGHLKAVDVHATMEVRWAPQREYADVIARGLCHLPISIITPRSPEAHRAHSTPSPSTSPVWEQQEPPRAESQRRRLSVSLSAGAANTTPVSSHTRRRRPQATGRRALRFQALPVGPGRPFGSLAWGEFTAEAWNSHIRDARRRASAVIGAARVVAYDHSTLKHEL